MTRATPYQQLEDRFRRFGALRDAEGFLHWDLATMMPEGGSEARAEQLAALKAVQHAVLTDPMTKDLLDEAGTKQEALDDWQRANLVEMGRVWMLTTALDEDMVVRLSKAATACEAQWRIAREDGVYKTVLPSFRTLVALWREAATIKGERRGLDPYDALMDEHEPGVRMADVDPIFERLGRFLEDFLPRVLERQQASPTILTPEGPFAAETQRDVAKTFMKKLGFDFHYGRLDISLHPFCGGTPDDVRITTRYDEGDFVSGLMGVLHETGHALYDRGLPKKWRGQPIGEARGMAVHESQSLLVEMQVCRSAEFISFAQPILKKMLAGEGPAWETDNLTRLYQRVKPDFIRVDADEVTYPAHIILRYRLERDLIAGNLEVEDLPTAWNEGFEKLLGLKVANDRDGCLQDIHWYDGAFGYFPTYTLGAMMAAQLFDQAKKSDPAIQGGIRSGDFGPLMGWLGTHVHSQGARRTMQEILTEATGRALDPEAFTRHLERRYLA